MSAPVPLTLSVSGVPRYEVDTVVLKEKRGGFGKVRSATDLVTGAHVKVKTLGDQVAVRDPTAVERLDRESRLALRMSRLELSMPFRQFVHAHHTGVDPIHGRWLAMQNAPKSLRDRLEQSSIEDPVVLQAIFVQMALALALLHLQGLVHRDLKIQNVLMTGEHDGVPQLALCDLGIAWDPAEPPLTAIKRVVGTRPFVPPERNGGANHATPDGSWDMFQAAWMFVVLVEGRDIYPMPPEELVEPHLARTLPIMMETRRGVVLQHLMVKCASRAADDRPTALQALGRLVELVPASRPTVREVLVEGYAWLQALRGQQPDRERLWEVTALLCPDDPTRLSDRVDLLSDRDLRLPGADETESVIADGGTRLDPNPGPRKIGPKHVKEPPAGAAGSQTLWQQVTGQLQRIRTAIAPHGPVGYVVVFAAAIAIAAGLWTIAARLPLLALTLSAGGALAVIHAARFSDVLGPVRPARPLQPRGDADRRLAATACAVIVFAAIAGLNQPLSFRLALAVATVAVAVAVTHRVPPHRE